LLAFIAAERRELKGLLARVEGPRRLDWPVDFGRLGRLNGGGVVLVANGPGPKLAGRAADVVKEHQGVDGLVSIGFCGALDPALQAGDIFVATEILGFGPALPLASAKQPYKTGKLLSIDRVVTSAAEKSDLYSKGAAAVEMEAGALAERAKAWSVPFYAIRVVTDTADETFPLDFNALRDATGRFSRARILAAAACRPSVLLPELLKLNQRSKIAAQALGDFIADARF
jgi:adenosylhomocysteine nucleosidase